MRPVNRLLVVGDVMLDVTGAVEPSARDACAAGHLRAPLQLRLGGTGLVAAREARLRGLPEVGLWTSVGADATGLPDPAASAAIALLDREGIHDLLRPETGAPTGTVVCVTFAGTERLLLAEPGANALVDPAGPAAEVVDFAAGCDLVYLSGYALTVPSRAEQVMQLVKTARVNDALVVLDVVPHRINDVVPGLTQVLTQVDVLVGESDTLHRLYGVGPAPSSPAQVEALAHRILRHKRMAVLRPANDRELVAARNGPWTWLDTGYAELPAADRVGSLDRRAVRLLLNRLNGWPLT